ncbi:MAG: hypothetical protein PVH89_08280, partial [Gammaproteobacteria bacterium]
AERHGVGAREDCCLHRDPAKHIVEGECGVSLNRGDGCSYQLWKLSEPGEENQPDDCVPQTESHGERIGKISQSRPCKPNRRCQYGERREIEQ